MKNLIYFALLIPLIVIGQSRFGGTPYRAPNTLAAVPIQVMGEGRLAGLAEGTDLSSANVSNLFKGYWQTNCTWAVVTGNLNSASTLLKITTNAPMEKQSQFFMPTVTKNETLGDCSFIYNSLNTNDVYVQATWKSGFKPAILIVGFELMLSNWNADTFNADDSFRIGQDPYAILQFSDGNEISGKLTLKCHTPDPPQLGSAVILLDNGEVYQVLFMANGPRALGAFRIWQKLASGQKRYIGESFLKMSTNSGDALLANIFFTQHDDHGESTAQPSGGGKIFYSHYWMTTNVEFWDNNIIPQD